VVLSKESAGVLDQVRRTGGVDEATLLTLEKDEWVTRAWTYQEIVNSNSLFLELHHKAAGAGATSAS